MCKGGCFSFLNLAMITVLAVFLFQTKIAASQLQNEINLARANGPSFFTCSQLCKSYPWQTDTQYCCTSQYSTSCQTKNTCFSSYIDERQEALSPLNAKFTYQIIVQAVLCMILVWNCCRSKPRRREYEERIRGEAIMARLVLQTVIFQRNRRIAANRARSILTESFIAEDDKDGTCAVCLDAFQQERVVKLNCQHLFHSKCIEQWIQNNPTCPVCRAEQ